MTNLFLDRILEFYGVPQILVAKDSFGTQYLCLLFDDGAGCRYTGIKISSSRLDDYWGGRIDLRTLYLNPENDNEYFNVSYNDNHYELQSFEGKALPEERLPEKGYFSSVDTEANKITFVFFFEDEELEPLYQTTRYDVYRKALEIATSLHFNEYSDDFLRVDMEMARLMLEEFQNR